MDAVARLTSKGQVTLPKAVRETLELHAGDNLHFRVEGKVVVLARTPDLLELAGAVEVPPELQGRDWNEIRETAWSENWQDRQ